jgi:hypothetical protein
MSANDAFVTAVAADVGVVDEVEDADDDAPVAVKGFAAASKRLWIDAMRA